jgi:hypothetical protein
VTPPEDRLLEVKAGLLGVWKPGGVPVGELREVLDHEPTKAPKTPLLTMQTRGFDRARLESPDVRAPIIDPIGGRRWVWKLWVRVWVGLKSDVAAAQRTLDVLIPQVVVALEDDRTLGGVAVDAALETGDVAIVRPKDGNPILMLSSACVVETEEPLN